MTTSAGISLAFDLYPGDSPRNGDLLVRLTKDDYLDGTMYRAALSGTGNGTIVLPANHAAVLAGYLVPDNYVRVVDLDIDEVIGGFFLEEGEQVVLSEDEEGGERISFSGRGTLAYLSRATYPHTLHSLADESFELHQSEILMTGIQTFNGPETYGGVLGRVIAEARLDIPSAVPDLPAHSWDDAVDSGGTAWTTFSDYYEVTAGDNTLDICADLMQKGIDLMLHPHTFVPSAYLAGTYGTDRTSATFASGKVRFEAGVNIAADLDKAIHRIPYISHMMVVGDTPGATYIAVDPDWTSGDTVYKGTLRLDTTSDPTIMEEAGLDAIRRRKLVSDQATFPHLPGDTYAAGLYRPGLPGGDGDYWLGDLVTLHTGTADNDYNEQPIQVAAITWVMRSVGTFDPVIDLGAQYVTTRRMAEGGKSGTTVGCCPIPYCTTTLAGDAALLDGECGTSELDVDADYLIYQASVADAGDVPCMVTDGNDLTWTQLAAPVGASYTWIAADLKGAREVSSVRLVQYNGVHGTGADEMATAWVLQSSDDWGGPSSPGTGTWTTRYTAGATGVDSGVLSVTGGSHRYWRIKATAGGAGGWVVCTWELFGGGEILGTNDLTGTSTDVARCDHNHRLESLLTLETDTDLVPHPDGTGGIVWGTDSGGASDLYLYNIDGGKDVVNTVAASGSTETLDLATGNVHDVTLTANCTLTLTGATTGKGCSITLLLRQDGTGSRTVTWPGSVVWPDATPPTLSTAAGSVDVFTLFTLDGGTVWFGFQAGGAGAVSALDDLTDVAITSPATADRLRYNGSAWVNSALVWTPLTVYDPTTGNYLPLVDGSGNQLMSEV